MKSITVLQNRINKYVQQLRDIQNEKKQIEKQKKKFAKVEREFAEYPQVVLHRRRGWTHEYERALMADFLRRGIEAIAIAAKFAVSKYTVYNHHASQKIKWAKA